MAAKRAVKKMAKSNQPAAKKAKARKASRAPSSESVSRAGAKLSRTRMNPAPKSESKSRSKIASKVEPKVASKAASKVAPKIASKAASKASTKNTLKNQQDPAFHSHSAHRSMSTTTYPSLRFAGVSLAGGKTDKTAVAVLEYFPDRKRVFLRTLRDKMGSGSSEEGSADSAIDAANDEGNDDASASERGGANAGKTLADQELFELLTVGEPDLTSIMFDAPLQFPKCIRCELPCPGIQLCKLPEIKWMWAMHNKRAKEKRPNKMFTPYTERCAEIHIANELEEPFHPSHALGSNAAPLTARAHYLVRRLTIPCFEALPKLTLWRVGTALLLPKSYLRFHKHAVDSDEARLHILRTLVDKEIAFIYQQDLKVLVESGQAFDAFLCAFTGFLKHRGQTEPRPSDFPKSESWIDFPIETVDFSPRAASIPQPHAGRSASKPSKK